MTDAKEIKRLLSQRVEDVAAYLFPDGKRESNHWCAGDITGAPGKSFKICLIGEKVGLWGDFANAEKHSNSLLDLWMAARNVDFKTALHEAKEWLGCSLHGSNGSRPRETSTVAVLNEKQAAEPFDWHACVEAFIDKHIERLAEWRGYSRETCQWLKDTGLVGIYDGELAFPVHDGEGHVVAVHCRKKNGKWHYPLGGKVRPLVIGELLPGESVHLFESQFDAFAFMDVSGERSGIIITRGASNGALVADLVPQGSTVYLWTQHDNGADKWESSICANTSVLVKRANIPALRAEFDLNDWTRAGATENALLDAMLRAETLSAPVQPPLLGPLLDAVCEFLRSYVVFSLQEQPMAIALWVAHTWTLDAFDYTPYLHVYSAEKRSGKTRLLDVLQLLTPRAWRAVSPSVPVLFRRVERDKPTLLYDEVDTVFHNAKTDGTEDVRSFLNTGFERGATISRCVGQNANLDLKDFDCFCSKALSGIGKVLPDTVSDRCIPIELVRQSREEKAKRFRKREAESKVASIRAGLEAWAGQAGLIDALRDARPTLPDELTDRQQDICEPLLAIADLAGGEWPEKARQALIKLCVQSEDASTGVKLLAAIWVVFDSTGSDRLPTIDILTALVAAEDDAPWALWWEDDLAREKLKGPATRLARLLKPYGIKPCKIRAGDETFKGYYKSAFKEAWERYLPPSLPLTGQEGTKGTNPLFARRKDVPFTNNQEGTVPSLVEAEGTQLSLVKRQNVPFVPSVPFTQDGAEKDAEQEPLKADQGPRNPPVNSAPVLNGTSDNGSTTVTA